MTKNNGLTNYPLPVGVSRHFVMVGDVKTHYLEAGQDNVNADTVMLLHSAEYSARAQFSWFLNIGELGKHFHVYAPDLLGFGYTDKVHDFTRQWDARMSHVRRFMEVLCIPEAHFIGSSFSGGLLQRISAMIPSPWNMISYISSSGGSRGGIALPNNDATATLQGYDGTKEWMKRILQAIFYDEKWWTPSIVEERWLASIEPGAWEALSAGRVARPGAERPSPPGPPDFSKITVPVLLVCGDEDELRSLEVQKELHGMIDGSEFHSFPKAKHNVHIEYAEEFNQLAIDFFIRNRTKRE